MCVLTALRLERKSASSLTRESPLGLLLIDALRHTADYKKTQAQENITYDHDHRPQHEQVQIDDYIVSWENYCRLFDALLDCSDTNFVITEAWAFDLINEFVYQFQSFCQKRPQVGLSLPLPSGPSVMVHSNFDVGCSYGAALLYLCAFFFVDSV